MKSTRDELKRLAILRLRESKSLIDAGLFDGGYYLAGLSVECALKACIAKKTQQHDFPDRQVVQDSWSHDLEKLVRTAGLQETHRMAMLRNTQLAQSWAVVKEWNVEDRYKLNRPRKAAHDLYRAVADEKFGVLRWIKRRW